MKGESGEERERGIYRARDGDRKERYELSVRMGKREKEKWKVMQLHVVSNHRDTR